VSFYDVRGAHLAMQMLGGPQYCRLGPQTGDRLVSLPGDVQINKDDVAGVSNVYDDGDGYKVEFFDFRTADRVRSASDAETKEELDPGSELVEPPPGLEHLAPPPGIQQSKAKAQSVYIPDTQEKGAPKYRGLKDVTNMPSPGRPQQAIMIQGLPNMLCNDTCFEATIQQAGFQASVVHFSTKPGKPCGEAIVWLSDIEGAQLCVAHFQGRKWDNASGTVVRAWCVDGDLVPSISDPWCMRKRRCDTGMTNASTECPEDEDPEA